MVGIVIIGGIVAIARVTSFLVPFMCLIYVIAALVVLVVHAGAIPAAFGVIFSEAFSGTAVGGAIVGVLIQGIKRAVFSNKLNIAAGLRLKISTSENMRRHISDEKVLWVSVRLADLLEALIDDGWPRIHS